jgi:hypothetical protein
MKAMTAETAPSIRPNGTAGIALIVFSSINSPPNHSFFFSFAALLLYN